MILSAQILVEHAHHQVVEDHVDVLGDLHAHHRRVQRDVAQFLEFAAGIAGDADDLAPLGLGVFHSVEHVFGVAAAGDGHQHIVGL